MGAIADMIFKMTGTPDPRDALTAALAGQGGGGTPATLPAAGATPGAQGMAPGTAGPAPPPPVSPLYQSPPDLVKLYSDLMDRQAESSSFDRGVGLIGASLAQAPNRAGIMQAFTGAGPSTDGTDPATMMNNMLSLKANQNALSVKAAQRQAVPAIAKQYGLDDQTALYLFDTGKLDQVIAEASKPNRQIIQDPVDGQHHVVNMTDGSVGPGLDAAKPREVELVENPVDGGKIAVDKITKMPVGQGDIPGAGNTEAQKNYTAAMRGLTPDDEGYMTFKDWLDTQRKSTGGYLSVGGGKVFDTKEGKYVTDPNTPAGLTPEATDPNNAPVLAPGQTDDAYLKTLPQNTQGLIKGLADYTLDATKISSVRGDQRQQLVAAAKRYDPSFDMTQFAARQKMRNSVAGGPIGQNLQALNTVIGHIGDLTDKGEKLSNTSYPMWNTVKNAWDSNVMGDPAQTNFEESRQAVASEMAKVFRGAGSMSEKEIGDWKDTLSSAQSPAQMKGAIQTALHLLSSRLDAVKSQYNTTMNKPWNTPFLNPKSQEVLKKLGLDPTEMDPTIASDAGSGDDPAVTDLLKKYGKAK